MAKKVFIGVGHGGSDPGAVKYVKEKDVNLVMAKACRDYLEDNGVQVLMSRTKDEDDTLSDEIKECNAYAPDVAIDIHNNAGRGDGFEVYHTINGGVGKTLAQNLETEVKAIGQNSRGVKTRKGSSGKDYYGFIRETTCPAVIVEGFFVDNATDYKIADTKAEQQAFGVAYAKAILKTLGVKVKAEATIKAGDKVKVLKAVVYGTNKTFKKWYDQYDVLSVSGDRVVIGIGKTVTAPIHINNIQKV